ncbi:ATP-binding protein [Georgenia sp. 10Sc9-8]|uniref:ATP-binding protein n=1 Tax=Georgenia halotolerans TaxID=3028317 RepID=A0ABT5TXY1_9MICO|nr:ATP-binding protein [Georgenia halotolerans]
MSEPLPLLLATLARRLADLLDATAGDQPGSHATGTFLRVWADNLDVPADDAASPLARLRDRMTPTPEELELLALAGLAEEHEGLASTFRELHPQGEPWPTVGLATHLVLPPRGRPDVTALLHGGALVRHGVLTVSGDRPVMERSLRVGDGLWSALTAPDLLGPGVLDLGPCVPGLEGWLAVVGDAVTALREPARSVVLVLAEDEPVGLSRCAAVCGAAGVRALPRRADADDAPTLARLSAEAVARGRVPVAVVPARTDGGGARGLDTSRVTGPLLVCAAPGAVRLDGTEPVLALPAGPVAVEDRRRAWAAVDNGRLTDLAPLLATRHPLDPALIAQVGADLRGRSDPPPAELAGAVSRAVRARASTHLPPGVSLTTPAVAWERLVLPAEAEAQLHEAVSRLQHQALVLDEWGVSESARAAHGVRLLLTGPPGTGKSLVAEVVATAAATDLLTVDVSNVVSKWLGETEKNLAAVFDVAERTQAVLLLDEADALFGARTQVSDAHDRYANLETAYLLQRLDRFEGLAVLATNLRQNIDPAFLRRVDAVVELALPDARSRRRLWDLHLPAVLRAPDVDLEHLAESYPVPGGWIHNAAVAATFLAAEAGGPVRRDQLVHALAREYAKDSRSFPQVVGPSRRRLAGPVDQRAVRSLTAATAPKESP